MCLVVFSFKEHENYKLVVGANRDEFYERPTDPAHFWEDYPHILGGRDRTACGTWLGVTRKGKISLLTNYRDPRNIKKDAPSRGNLVGDFLKKDISPRDYLENISSIGHAYNGFNLILGTHEDLWYYTNQKDKIYRLGSGLYGISNAVLNTKWPKVEKAKENFRQILNKELIDPDEILNFLYDDKKAPEDSLPDTGIGQEREKLLSPIFIKSENYGTRSSTVVLVDNEDVLSFTERVYNPIDYSYNTNSYKFKIG